MSLLVARQLACVKNDRQLFAALDLELSAGQLIHLRGPNGAGKTSLLRLLTGLSQPASGQVVFRQQPVFNNPEFQQHLIYIGHQAYNNPRLSAIENLTFWCRSHGVPVPDDLYPLLAMLGLVGLEDVPVGHLSAGQQRRVALARLWLKPAALWILDEPFTALDVQAIALLESHIAAYLQQGGSVLMTSHQALSNTLNADFIELEYLW
ncbi:cytochrome c biogenesis heme-transporting ATPase CcmA [Pseudobowmanella zhangzhouensis]|uniref:cytochrome c biogenesis heme-transporting ATPase CcmA n=1 Tax=Pseudobowmanella zhangzhouensis TaxID=1537679 RepID=UPI0036137B43